MVESDQGENAIKWSTFSSLAPKLLIRFLELRQVEMKHNRFYLVVRGLCSLLEVVNLILSSIVNQKNKMAQQGNSQYSIENFLNIVRQW
jgi:hypothetical protein